MIPWHRALGALVYGAAAKQLQLWKRARRASCAGALWLIVIHQPWAQGPGCSSLRHSREAAAVIRQQVENMTR